MKNVIALSVIILLVVTTNAQTGIVRNNSGKQAIRDQKQDRVIALIEPVSITKIESLKTSVVYLTPIRVEGTTTINRQQLMSLPQRNINSIAGTVAGVDSRNGQIPNIRGARQDGTAYYIDGVRVAHPELVDDFIR